MKILGIETSGLQGSIALLEDKHLRKEVNLKAGLVHGKYLIPSIKKALHYLGWQPKKLDFIAVDIGPGSYTGLRVGLATVKTLAYALKIHLLGVSSLDVLAENIKPRYEYICPVIDAKWNQVYSAIYQRRGSGCELKGESSYYKRISEYLAITPEEFLKRLPKGVFLFGDGLNRYRNILMRADIKTSGTKKEGIPRAVNVARLGRTSYLNGECANPFELVPLYLRPTEAEVKFKR